MNRLKPFLLLSLILLLSTTLWAQQQEYKVGVIGFYNLENLFDTVDDPDKWDEQFLPDGDYNYTEEIYAEKLDHLSDVIALLGKDMSPDGVSVLGVSEVENRRVLEDLVKEPELKDRNYQIVHHESPDERGVDVALLYNPTYFKVIHSKALFVDLEGDDGKDEQQEHEEEEHDDEEDDAEEEDEDENEEEEEEEEEDDEDEDEEDDTNYTRDVLWVYGEFDGEPTHIFVNHWPSRRGGEVASSPLREKAAAVAAGVIDSLMKADPDTRVIVMGDLNDDPVNKSVSKVLGAKPSEKKTKEGELYNPWYKLYKKGIGTLAWRDAWNLFDQIIISEAYLDKDQEGYFFYQPVVFNKKFLTQQTGRYKGYPFRAYVGGQYQGGYSDHFPVFIYLLKAVD